MTNVTIELIETRCISNNTEYISISITSNKSVFDQTPLQSVKTEKLIKHPVKRKQAEK